LFAKAQFHLSTYWHTFGILGDFNTNIMENININTLNLLKAFDMELKELLLADLLVIRSKQAA
jgi:hypothetical protein